MAERTKMPPAVTAVLLLSVASLARAQIEFDCPKPSGLFSHPEQCDRYFDCRNGIARRMLCADGLVFDPDKVGVDQDPCDHVQVKQKLGREEGRLQSY